MSTLRQIIYSIKNPIAGGVTNRASTFSDRQIAFMIKEARNFFLYRDLSNKNNVPPQYEQDLGCCKLEDVDQADCPNAKWGTIVKVVNVPTFLDLPGNAGLTFFGLIDKRQMITLPSANYGDLNDYMPFHPKKNMEGQQIGNKIYVYGEAARRLCYVNIRGVLADPTQACPCATVDSEPCCFDWDKDEYPIPAHLEPLVYEWVSKTFIYPNAPLPRDIENDEVDKSVV